MSSPTFVHLDASGSARMVAVGHKPEQERTAEGITFEIEPAAVRIVAEVSTTAKTGVEMEALTAVSVAALTIYDMCKAVDKGMVIGDIRVTKKVKA